jgi:hypothetical protein
LTSLDRNKANRTRARIQFNKFRKQQKDANFQVTTEVVRWLDGWAIVKGCVYFRNVLAQFPTREEATAAFRVGIANNEY